MKKTKRYAEGDEVDGNFYEAGSGSESDYKDDQTSETPTPSAKAAAPKRAIVTKEQLAASPYDNLRDYLNAQQNLKRRDGSASSKPAPKAEAPAPKAESKPAPKAETPAPKAEAPAPKAETKTETTPKSSGTYRDISGKVRSKTDDGESERAANRSKIAEAFSSGKKFREMLGSKYKSGGSVSSRGDGIAQRGKTKGRFC